MTATQTRHTLDLTDADDIDCGTVSHKSHGQVAYLDVGGFRLLLPIPLLATLGASLQAMEDDDGSDWCERCGEYDCPCRAHVPFCDCPECMGC